MSFMNDPLVTWFPFELIGPNASTSTMCQSKRLWRTRTMLNRGRFHKGWEMGVLHNNSSIHLHLTPKPNLYATESFSKVGHYTLWRAPNFIKLTPGFHLNEQGLLTPPPVAPRPLMSPFFILFYVKIPKDSCRRPWFKVRLKSIFYVNTSLVDL